MGRMDPSHRFAQQIVDAINNGLCDVESAVSLVTMSGPAVKVKLFAMARKVIYNLALEYDYNDFDPVANPDHARAVIAAKKLQEILDREWTAP